MLLHKVLLLLLFPLALSSPAGAKPVSHDDQPIKPVSIGDHRTASLRRGHLVAWDAHASLLASVFGERLAWVFGDRLGERSYRNDDGQWQQEDGLVFASGGRVFTYSQTGALFAVSARTGRQMWSTPMRLPFYTTRNKYGTWRTPNIQTIDGNGNTLAVATHSVVAVYDARTGREHWRVILRDEFSGVMAVYVMPDVVLRSRYVEGAGMHEETEAYDELSGKRLWNADGVVDLGRSHKGQVDLEKSYLGEIADHPAWRHHQIVAERTGKVLKEYLTE